MGSGQLNTGQGGLSMKFNSYLRAGYPALWVQTDEESRALSVLYQESGDCSCFTWDMVTGITELSTGNVKAGANPLQAIQSVSSLPENSVLFLLDFHVFLKSPEIVRAIKNSLPGCKASGRHLVIVSPVLAIPVELSKLVTVVDFDLPGVQELQAIAQGVVDQVKANGNGITFDAGVMEYARGLTAIECENAVARSLVEYKAVVKDVLEQEKIQAVKKSGLCELYRPESINNLKGLDLLKEYIAARKEGFSRDKGKPKGVILAGAPGTGKSLSARCIASVFGFPLFKADSTTFKGGIVGESEKKTKDFWRLVRAASPCVVWIDEAEKVFSGVQSSGRTDGGAGAGAFGIFLSEMQDTFDQGFPVYVVATVNDMDELLASSQGALLRRFDDVFFVDLPNENERFEILDFMCAKYGAQAHHFAGVNMQGWSGAEIEKLVVASLYEGAEKAAANIHTVYEQNQTVIDRAREWARVNARPANKAVKVQELKARRLEI